jgi:hypothetical protein
MNLSFESNINSLTLNFNESSIIEPSILYKTIIYSITIPIFILTAVGLFFFFSFDIIINK